jgi:hypothetical protein
MDLMLVATALIFSALFLTQILTLVKYAESIPTKKLKFIYLALEEILCVADS